jgi:heavy metal efflux system protein
VILVENIFRNFQASPKTAASCSSIWPKGSLGADPTRQRHARHRGLDRSAAADLGQRAAGRQGDLFSAAITVAAFVPLFTMQGVEGQIFGPMARTYGYALWAR